MRNAVAYYREWLTTPSRHAFGRADVVAGVLGIFGPPLLRWLGIENAEAVMSSLAWQIPLSCFVLVAVFRIVAAPYWMHQEEQGKRAAVQAECDRLASLLDDRRRKALAKDGLAILLEHATELRQSRVTNDPE